MSALEQREPGRKRSPSYTDADLRALGLERTALRVALYAREAGHFRKTLRPAIPNREIAERLGVSVRSVQRAKAVLEEVGIVPARAGRYSGYEGPHGRENLADVYVLDRRLIPALGGRHLAVVAEVAPATPETRGGDSRVTPYGELKHPTSSESPSGSLGGGVAARVAEPSTPPAAPASDELDEVPAAPAGSPPAPAAALDAVALEPATEERCPPPAELLEPALSVLRAALEKQLRREGAGAPTLAAIEQAAEWCARHAGVSPFQLVFAKGVLAGELGVADEPEPESEQARRKREREEWADGVDWDELDRQEHYELGDGDPPAEGKGWLSWS